MELPPVRYATASDGVRIAYMRWPDTSPPLFSVNTPVARHLSLSTRTIERHVRNIDTKLGVHNRTQAANWARDHGVV
jgi:hypothetical protein